MSPIIPALKRNEDIFDSNTNTNTSDTSATAMGNYGTTEEHEQSSLIGALPTDVDTSLQISTSAEDETQSLAGATTNGEATLISNASTASHYFKPKPTHNSSDSLDYSTTSSTIDMHMHLPPHYSTENHHHHHNEFSSRSYLGSIVKDLGRQQAFPSSMFPGQKLISPVSSRETIKGQESNIYDRNNTQSSPSSRAYPSYYYYSGSTSSGSGGNQTLAVPLSYQNTTKSNVYKKRCKAPFCANNDEDVAYDIDDGSRLASWKKCMRCFFSPRVLATLLVCGVIVINLLRMGGRHHRGGNHKSRIRGNGSGGSSTSLSKTDPEYVKLEAIGGSSNNSFGSDSSILSLFEDTKDP